MKQFLSLATMALFIFAAFPVMAQDDVATPPTAAQENGIAKRVAAHLDAVTKGMELTDDQKSALESALSVKYKGNASKLNIDTPYKERQKIWKESNAVFNEELADKFSKKELRQANQLIRAANEVGRIFNGKDLTGWEQVNGTATYEVIEGAIVGTTATGSPNSFLATTKKYGNFDLQFEVFLVNNELNSGVQIRSNQHTEETLEGLKKKHPVGRVFGYQCELEASAEGDMDKVKYGDAGYIYDEARRGWLVDDETRHAAKTRNAFRNQKWNRVRIRAMGDHIETWINGKKICDLKDDMTASGFIALQVHGIGKKEDKWQVKWRNIKIKELK